MLPHIPSLRFLVIQAVGHPSANVLPVHDFDAFCNLPTSQDWRDVGIEKDLVGLLYTSGSTGKPKGVMLSHAQIMAGSSIVSTYLGITAEERILAVLPFSFDASAKTWRRPAGRFHLQLGHSATSFDGDASIELPAATLSVRRSPARP